MFFLRKKANRKWHSKPQLYKGRLFYIKQVMQAGIGFVVFIAFVALYLYFKNSDALGIRHVEVLGELKHVSQEDVIKASGIQKHNKLFAVSLSELRTNVNRLGWIEETMVRREFPDTIQIYVKERTPVAILLADSFYYVDKNGVVFMRVKKDDLMDLPVITGFVRDDLVRYPHLMKTYLNLCMAFLDYIGTQDFYKQERISEVHFDRVLGMTVYTSGSALEIFYGRDQYTQKQDKLEKFRISNEYKTTNYVRLDLDKEDRIVARKL